MRRESPSPRVSRDWPKAATDSVIAARQSKAASRRAVFGETAAAESRTPPANDLNCNAIERQDSCTTFMDDFLAWSDRTTERWPRRGPNNHSVDPSSKLGRFCATCPGPIGL